MKYRNQKPDENYRIHVGEHSFPAYDPDTIRVLNWDKYKKGNISPTSFYQEPELSVEYF